MGASQGLLARNLTPLGEQQFESGMAGPRLIARLDNLGKGASGAAVQNLNIMAGLDETAGLRL